MNLSHKGKADLRHFSLALCFLLPYTASSQGKGLIQYVNPFIGTSSSNVFTRWGNEGGTFPGAVAPWGYFQLTPETGLNGKSGYDYKDSTISYFSCLQHHSGFPGGSAGKLHVMPVASEQTIEHGRRFRHQDEHAEPGYYRVLFRDNGTLVEATATVHAGLFRITFPAGTVPEIFISDADDLSTLSAVEMEGRSMRRSNRSGKATADTQNIILIRFNRSITDTQKLAGRSFIKFQPAPEGNTVLNVELSTSSTGYETALDNMDAGLTGNSFEQVLAKTQAEWNKQLSVVSIVDPSEENKTIFYSALYHSLLLPWIISDVHGYYRGSDRQVHKTNGANEYGGFSPWDTFRSLHPLLCLLYPGRQADMLSSMLDIYRQSGYLPTESMTGNHSIPILVDSYLKGIKNLDSTVIYEAMKKSIVTGPFKQKDMALYQKGFIPYPYTESVTRTVEYTYDDWALARFAGQVMHDQNLYAKLMQRSRNYRNLFNPDELCLLPRKGNTFYHATGNAGYKEGDQWVYTYFLPHYQRDLINLLGGDKNFIKGLDSAREDKRIVFDNETLLHAPYLFNSTAYPYKTQEWVHDIMHNRFGNSPGGLPGNDDLGAISSWYVWSALGLFPVCPGNPVYAIGTPLFKEATLSLPEGKKWKILSGNNSAENFYVKSITINGQSYHEKWLPHATLIQGGEISFNMDNKPDKEKIPGFIPEETDSSMQVSLSGFYVREHRIKPDAPFWVRFTIHNTGAAGTAIIRLHVNDSLVIQKNCFITDRTTLHDSLLCRLYAYGRNKLQIEGMPAREVTVVRPRHPVSTAPEIVGLQASPVTRMGNWIYASYIVKNKGGDNRKFVIPVMLNGKAIFRDTVILNAGDSFKIRHSIRAALKEGLYALQVNNNTAKTKIYTDADDAVVLDIPEEIHFSEKAKDISGFGNDGYKSEEGDFTSLPHTASLDSNGTTLTMMAWINDPGDKWKLTDLLAKGDNHVLQLKGTSELSFFAGGWGRGDCSVPLPGNWRNNWHHIAGVCNGTDLRVYIDGALNGVTPLEKVIDLYVAAAWSIGGNEEFPLDRSFDGKIRGVKIFNAALDEAGVKAIYLKEKSAIAGAH
ncbi:MAG: GH92 family glycosyl hydrolase [Bacteroidota bacterium]|nr:GH92 family glycosyl hydrolase [Bacteroidota bacterium]